MTTTVDLRVDAEGEARRLAAARLLDRPPGERATDPDRGSGPLIALARGARRRKALAGRTLFIWQVGCEDSAGRRSPATIVAFLASVRFADGGGRDMANLRNLINAIDVSPPDAMRRALSAMHIEIADAVRAQAMARLERERAIADDVAHAPSGAGYQAGLFDRRSERDHQRRNADAERATAAAGDRVAAATAAATVTALRPALLLVLTAAS